MEIVNIFSNFKGFSFSILLSSILNYIIIDININMWNSSFFTYQIFGAISPLPDFVSKECAMARYFLPSCSTVV